MTLLQERTLYEVATVASIIENEVWLRAEEDGGRSFYNRLAIGMGQSDATINLLPAR